MFCIEKENPVIMGFSFLRIWKFHKQTNFNRNRIKLYFYKVHYYIDILFFVEYTNVCLYNKNHM